MGYSAFWTRANFAFPTGFAFLVGGVLYQSIFTGRPGTMTREISKSEFNVSAFDGPQSGPEREAS